MRSLFLPWSAGAGNCPPPLSHSLSPSLFLTTFVSALLSDNSHYESRYRDKIEISRGARYVEFCAALSRAVRRPRVPMKNERFNEANQPELTAEGAKEGCNEAWWAAEFKNRFSCQFRARYCEYKTESDEGRKKEKERKRERSASMVQRSAATRLMTM